VATTSSKKWVRKGIGVLLILACTPITTAGNDLGLTAAILLTTIGLILIFFG